MSIIQLLVMDETNRPELGAIKQSAKSEEVPYVPHDKDLASHQGFLPVDVGKLETGFEYFFEAMPEAEHGDDLDNYGTHYMVARTGGDAAEMYASLLFFRTAARLSGAAYVYVDDGIIVPPEEVEGYLTQVIKDIESMV